MADDTASFKKIVFIAILVGIISGFGALLFFEGLKLGTHFFMDLVLGYQMPQEGQSVLEIAQWTPSGSVWLILPVICLGGLISGLIVDKLAPEIEGPGKDAAISAFHGEGSIRKRVPFLKALATIFVISTGGSAGREGPTAQISAGLGSLMADILGLSGRDRRIAIVTGIGAGVGTIFKAPLGGAILAAEVLYIRDFESDAVIPSFIASVIGYSIFCSFEGFDPIFGSLDIEWSLQQIPLFFLLGVICAGFGILYIRSFFGTKTLFDDVFTKYNLPEYAKPVVGAFLTGILVVGLAYISLDAKTVGLAGLGTGYGFFQLTLYSMLPLSVLIFLPFVKILTTSFTIGSGGSGGVFGPGLVIGGATGGAVGELLHIFFPSLVPSQAVPVFIIVGMISLFGAIANAPLAVMIMVIEMTGDFSLLVPAMGAVAISYLLTGEESIFIEQVKNKAHSDAHRGEYEIEILDKIPAGSVMVKEPDIISLSPMDSCDRVLDLINKTGHNGFPVLEGERLVGLITIGDVRQLQAQDALSIQVGEGMVHDLVTIYPDTTLEEALEFMITNDIHHLPVVNPKSSDQLLGFLTRSDIMRAYAHSMTRLRSGKIR
jgi:CIC family chloride channel protein